MSDKKSIGNTLLAITDDFRTIIRGEIELAKAEVVPQVKSVAKGAGMFGVAGYFALVALSMLFTSFALGTAWLLMAQANMEAIPACFAGFGIWGIIFLVITGILALIGKINVTKLKGPQKAIALGESTISAIRTPFEAKAEDVKDAAAEAGEKAKKAASNIADRVSEKVDDLKATAESVVDEAKKTATDVKKSAEDLAK